MKMSKRIRSVFLLLAFVITIMPVTDASAKTKIKLNKTTLAMTIGDTSQLKLSGTSAGVKWSSSKSTVAKVSQKGMVTAKKAGKAVITAKTGTKKYFCNVTVKVKGEAVIQGRYQRVVNYINYNGTKVSDNENILYVALDNYSTAGIGYEKNTRTVVFVMANEVSGVDAAVTMKVRLSNVKKGNITCYAEGSDASFQTTAVMNTDSYNGKNIAFKKVSSIGFDSKDIQNCSNLNLRIALMAWDVVLHNKCSGMSLQDLGFGVLN